MTPKTEVEEEDFEIEKISDKDKIQSQVIVGDIMIASSSSLPKCQRAIKNLLKDKDIKGYLNLREKKMLRRLPLGVG